jgi:aminoglycoside phosphotransferase (APT) family kinase protein
MIPESKIAGVKHALEITFGVNEFEEILQLTAGLTSALIFRIVVLGKPYLLRIITRTDAMGDPTHYYACMQSAAAAGLAPRVWYAGIEDRISITDFVEAKAFPLHEARKKMPAILRRLHMLPPFAYRFNYLDFVEGSIRRFLDAKMLPERMTANIFFLYSKISSVYPRNTADMVSCHNDLKPENILFDGDRVWLVDWEAAFLNDRYFDLAVVANFLVKSEQEEKDFLQAYFGETVHEYHHARFFLMQQVAHMAYFTFLLSMVFAAGKPIELPLAQTDFSEFHNQIWAGKINLANDEARQQYAWLHFEQLRNNLQQKRFEASLQVVSTD